MSDGQEPHLWEVDHDFYGPDGGYQNQYDSWQEFIDGDGHQIEGLNLLYRWDWQAWHLQFPEDYPDGQESHELQLFWIMPRKSAMGNDTIKVTPADEPAVRAWLQKHADYMRKLWAPLRGAA
jgi:hypothetical protein